MNEMFGWATIIGLLLFSVFGMVFCQYMLWRNDKIFQFCEKLVKEDFETYKRLPSYKKMMNCFWVWPLEKFLKN